MRRLLFLFSLAVVGINSLYAQKIEFKAIAPETVVVGQQFRLTFSVNEEANANDLRIQELTGFDVAMGPSTSVAQSTRIANGERVSEITSSFTYILIAKEEGTFNIPPATLKVKNANYSSNALTIKVLPQDKTNGGSEETQQRNSTSSEISNEELFMRMIVSKNSVYEQEPIFVTFKLYFTTNVTPGSFKFPEFEGFQIQEIEQPREISTKLENYKGRNYQTAVVKEVFLYPQRTGKITIEGGKYDVTARVQTQQRARSLFDDFFGSYRDVNKTLTTSPITIDVKSLPSGKPADYANAVGDFKMTTNISATDVKADEAITITIKINGTGNIRLIKNPEVVFPNDFEVYDPTVKLDTKITSSGVSGTKTIEYVAIPRYGGDFEIPSISFSYFDPKSGNYITQKSDPFKLHVQKGEGNSNVSGPVVSNFNNRESVRVLGQDIRYLKTKGIHFIPKGDIFYGSLMFYLCYIISTLLFLVFSFIYRKQVKENANIALVRTKKANKMAVKRLKNAGNLLKENKKEAFYEEVLRALWGYLSDKLNIPISSLTKDNIEMELRNYGVGEMLKNEFIDILNICEFARYAPSQASDTMEKVYEQTIDVIGKMENTIKK